MSDISTPTPTPASEKITFSLPITMATLSALALVVTIIHAATSGLHDASTSFLAFMMALVGSATLLIGRESNKPSGLYSFGFGILAASLGLVLFLTSLAVGA